MDVRDRDCISRVAGRQQVVRLLVAAGFGSRLECAALIRRGRVAVNGRVVRRLDARADPLADRLAVDGVPVRFTAFCRYILLNKPYGVLCAFTDDRGRPTLSQFVDVPGIYAAGRLDMDSEGLVLLTDDGWLSHRLTHPRFEHPKTYLVQVEGEPDEEALAALRRGVVVKGRRTAPAEVELLAEEPSLPPRAVPIRHRKTVPTAWLRIVLREGRKRQVRHMTAAVGHPTLRLVRVAIGPLALGDLQPGQWRELTEAELAALREMLGSPVQRR